MRRTALVLFLIGSLLATPALAKHGKKGKKKAHHAPPAALAVDVDVVFGSREREAVRGWIVESHGRGHCPPGLAKKNNGCLPPGQAKKRYVVGQRCPHGVEIGPLPAALEIRIGLPPKGYRYGIIDGDVVKLALGTLLVVDAIGGLVE